MLLFYGDLNAFAVFEQTTCSIYYRKATCPRFCTNNRGWKLHLRRQFLFYFKTSFHFISFFDSCKKSTLLPLKICVILGPAPYLRQLLLLSFQTSQIRNALSAPPSPSYCGHPLSRPISTTGIPFLVRCLGRWSLYHGKMEAAPICFASQRNMFEHSKALVVYFLQKQSRNRWNSAQFSNKIKLPEIRAQI